MHTFLVVVQVLVAVSLIGLVLIQHGKGADAGAAFGSGASGTVFGSRGAANFLSRVTAGLAFVFFVSSLALAYWVGGRGTAPSSVTDSIPVQQEAAPAPATTVVPGDDTKPAAAPPAEAPKVPE
ncbi:MAG: secG [Hydrocarboniphaga sp.]|uniref:preprotein translocase subunit SecG n=1 Tax=Hydrocarboniphaga sp. TaxID=2033016 RepID=UPI00262B0CD0|nr:preprotein translocase subunit SecG [Hydrocarboniphaga sp.]MDB5970747.1 secG [Hydrocarboniphaga sp.]